MSCKVNRDTNQPHAHLSFLTFQIQIHFYCPSTYGYLATMPLYSNYLATTLVNTSNFYFKKLWNVLLRFRTKKD